MGMQDESASKTAAGYEAVLAECWTRDTLKQINRSREKKSKRSEVK